MSLIRSVYLGDAVPRSEDKRPFIGNGALFYGDRRIRNANRHIGSPEKAIGEPEDTRTFCQTGDYATAVRLFKDIISIYQGREDTDCLIRITSRSATGSPCGIITSPLKWNATDDTLEMSLKNTRGGNK